MLIRQETFDDYKEVYELITEAFATAEHADGTEQDLVTALKKGNAFLPELSLMPEGIPAENFMAMKLLENADPICGAVTYAKEFGM